jgi:hypothetical protein
MSTEISTQRASTGLALQTFDDAFRFAKMVAASEFAPKDFKGKPESCLLAIQHGSEVGLSPMQSLQSIAVINGRPTIWGDAALALVQSSPVCEYVREYTEGEGDNLTAVCEAKRRGYPAPTVVRFSVADAKKAGLWGKSGPWSAYSTRMLQVRARGFALRNAFADALRGLITAEEAQDYPATEPAREPVVVRPKFPTSESRPAAVERGHAPATAVDSHAQQTAQPPATPANEERMQQSRLAVNRAKTVAELERFRSITEERLKAGAYTPSQADELFNLISHKLDWLTSEDNGQDFAHEAAEHEVQG